MIYSTAVKAQPPIKYIFAKKEDCPNVVEAFKGSCGKGNNLIIAGGTGTGKTHSIWAIYNRFVETGQKKIMRIVSMTDAIDALKDDIQSNSHVNENLLKKSDILALDDLGAEKITEWVSEKMFSIVDYRVNNKLPIIITTNLNHVELEERFGKRIMSRIRGGAAVVKLDGSDRRLNAS